MYLIVAVGLTFVMQPKNQSQGVDVKEATYLFIFSFLIRVAFYTNSSKAEFFYFIDSQYWIFFA